MKQAIKLASIAVMMTTLASLAFGQETRVYREGSNWVQEMTGDLGAAKNLLDPLAEASLPLAASSKGLELEADDPQAMSASAPPKMVT